MNLDLRKCNSCHCGLFRRLILIGLSDLITLGSALSIFFNFTKLNMAVCRHFGFVELYNLNICL